MRRSASSMFASTESHGNRAGSWNRTARSGPGPGIGRPSSSADPDVGSSRPARMLRMEVFPQPEGPSRHTNSPGATSNDTLSTATTLSPRVDMRVFTRLRTESLGVTGSGWGATLQRLGGERPSCPHRNLNFSAISICTDLGVLDDQDDGAELDLPHDLGHLDQHRTLFLAQGGEGLRRRTRNPRGRCERRRVGGLHGGRGHGVVSHASILGADQAGCDEPVPAR